MNYLILGLIEIWFILTRLLNELNLNLLIFDLNLKLKKKPNLKFSKLHLTRFVYTSISSKLSTPPNSLHYPIPTISYNLLSSSLANLTKVSSSGTSSLNLFHFLPSKSRVCCTIENGFGVV